MYQKMISAGNVGRDPEMRCAPAGVPVTSFTVAVNRRWTGADDQPAAKVTWFRVTCWRKLAEVAAQHIQKGKRVLVEEEIAASAYIARDGEARATLELAAVMFKSLSTRRAATESGSTAPETESDDPIPFWRVHSRIVSDPRHGANPDPAAGTQQAAHRPT